MDVCVAGDVEPGWLADNEPLQQWLVTDVAGGGAPGVDPQSSSAPSTGLEQKAQRKLRKLTSQVAKRQTHSHTDPRAFRYSYRASINSLLK